MIIKERKRHSKEEEEDDNMTQDDRWMIDGLNQLENRWMLRYLESMIQLNPGQKFNSKTKIQTPTLCQSAC
jgi:hypothetical protein